MASVLRIVLILLPFVVYFIWLRSVKRQRDAESTYRQEDIKPEEGRMLRAVGFAVATAIAVAVWVAMEREEHSRDALYVPPHTQNGTVVPGGFVDLPKDTDQTKQ